MLRAGLILIPPRWRAAHTQQGGRQKDLPGFVGMCMVCHGFSWLIMKRTPSSLWQSSLVFFIQAYRPPLPVLGVLNMGTPPYT